MYSTRTHEAWQFWLDMWHVKAVFFLGTKKSFKLRNLPSRTSTLFPSWRSTCPFPSQENFLRIFWYVLYFMLQKSTLLKENLCIYKCFLGVLYIFDSVGKIGKCARLEADLVLIFFCYVLSRFYLTMCEGIHDPVSVMIIAFNGCYQARV